MDGAGAVPSASNGDKTAGISESLTEQLDKVLLGSCESADTENLESRDELVRLYHARWGRFPHDPIWHPATPARRERRPTS